MQVDLPANAGEGTGVLGALFAEELGLVLEIAPEDEAEVCAAYSGRGLSVASIGSTSGDLAVSISVGGEPCISGTHS